MQAPSLASRLGWQWLGCFVGDEMQLETRRSLERLIHEYSEFDRGFCAAHDDGIYLVQSREATCGFLANLSTDAGMRLEVIPANVESGQSYAIVFNSNRGNIEAWLLGEDDNRKLVVKLAAP